MATVQEVITQKLNKEFEVGKNFGHTRVNELLLNKNACKTDVHQWNLRSDICSQFVFYESVCCEMNKNKPFFQPIHLDVINESFMHNVPKGKVLACISYF